MYCVSCVCCCGDGGGGGGDGCGGGRCLYFDVRDVRLFLLGLVSPSLLAPRLAEDFGCCGAGGGYGDGCGGGCGGYCGGYDFGGGDDDDVQSS